MKVIATETLDHRQHGKIKPAWKSHPHRLKTRQGHLAKEAKQQWFVLSEPADEAGPDRHDPCFSLSMRLTAQLAMEEQDRGGRTQFAPLRALSRAETAREFDQTLDAEESGAASVSINPLAPRE